MTDGKTFTQADIDALEAKHQEEMTGLSKRLNAEFNRKQEKALNELRAQIENEAKQANMSELERAQAKIKDLEAQNLSYKEKEDIALEKDEAKKFLKEIGISESNLDYVFIPKDMEGTKTKAKAFKEMLDNVKKTTFETGLKSTIPNNGTIQTNSNAAFNAAIRAKAGL